MITSFPLLDVFFTILWVFLALLWIGVIFVVIVDLFTSDDVGGVAKALWFVFIIFFPVIGVVLYLLVRGTKMAHRRTERAAGRQPFHEWFERDVDRTRSSGNTSAAEELERLTNLKDRGAITEDEFNRLKARVVGSA
jgi:hypothetical protein